MYWALLGLPEHIILPPMITRKRCLESGPSPPYLSKQASYCETEFIVGTGFWHTVHMGSLDKSMLVVGSLLNGLWSIMCIWL